MSAFEMKLSGKRFCSGTQAKRILEEELRTGLKRAGFILQGVLMRHSPVLSGTLRRSWSVGDPHWTGDKFIVKVGTALVYARIVNARGKSAGYIEKAVSEAKAQVKAAIREAVRRAIPRMYVAL